MNANNAICLVEDLWGLQSEGESLGEESSLMQDTTVQKSGENSRDTTTQGDKENGAKVKSDVPLMECWLHLLPRDICGKMYSKASFGVSTMGNIIRDSMLHTNHCVSGLLKPTFK